MSTLLSRIKAAHDARKMVAVEVPEYGVTLYFPALTLADHEAIRKGVAKGDEHALLIKGLIHQARNADGTPAFDDTPATKAELHRMELSLMQRIMAQAGGQIDGALAEQLTAVGPVAIAAALVSVLAEDAPDLAEVVKAAPPEAVVAALRDIAIAGVGATPVKKG